MDEHLYAPDGRFLFRGRTLGFCALKCSSIGNFVYDVGALGPSMRFCKGCILKHGPKNLRRDANVSLHNAKQKTSELDKSFKQLDKRYFEKFGVMPSWNLDALMKGARKRD